MAIPGRAETPKQKKALLDRLYRAWLLRPDERLGQLIVNSVGRDPFYREDEDLIAAAEVHAFSPK